MRIERRIQRESSMDLFLNEDVGIGLHGHCSVHRNYRNSVGRKIKKAILVESCKV